jgi:potassium/hydrogen antiporter
VPGQVPVHDVIPFATWVAVVGAAGLLAVWSNRVTEVLRVPAPALFLVAAALVAAVVPSAGDLGVVAVQRVVTVMLVLLLFDGGLHLGWHRLRPAVAAVAWVGVVGTFVTTAGIALVAHLLGFDWRPALLLGVALAPTDPAVVFSVLGRREVGGRTGTILEGESGANDPVGIAAMAAVLAAGSAGGWHSVGSGVREFLLQMLVGAACGLVGGWLLGRAMRRVPLPSGALYPLQTLLGAGAIYGGTTVLHGSGFLAVFIAGAVLGDLRAPYKPEIERFHSSLASLAEIVAFAVLGLTVDLGELTTGDRLAVALVLAVVTALAVRPLLVGVLLLPLHLSRGERVFVLWSGLKGAVPILLGTYLLTAGVDDGQRLYAVVVVVVTFSVIVQGGLVPFVARRSGVPMRTVEPEPWALGIRFRDEPTGMHRFHVAAGAPADGCSLDDLALGEDAWVSLVSRSGALVPVRGDLVLEPGDEVLLLAGSAEDAALRALFGA